MRKQKKSSIYNKKRVMHPSIQFIKPIMAKPPTHKQFKRLIRYLWKNYPKEAYLLCETARHSQPGLDNTIIQIDYCFYFRTKKMALDFKKTSKTI